MYKNLIAVLGYWSASMVAAQNLNDLTSQQKCTPILQIAAHNESYNTLQEKYKQVLYESACQNKNIKEGFDVDIDIGIPDVIDFGFGGGSKRDRVSNFCKTYDATATASIFSQGAQRTVVIQSIDAWKECIRTNDQVNITLVTTGGPKGFLVQMSRADENVTFTGINSFNSKLSCRSNFPIKRRNKIGASQDVDYTSYHEMSTADHLSIQCERTSEADSQGNTIYPDVEFAVTTTRGNLTVRLPRDRSGPTYESDWQKERGDLQRQNAALTQDLVLERSKRTTNRIIYSGGYGKARGSAPTCLPEEDAGKPEEFKTKPFHKDGWIAVACSKKN